MYFPDLDEVTRKWMLVEFKAKVASGEPYLSEWLTTQDSERLGYPTQKPEGLLDRIIRSSCPEEGVVLDPFCGCGTTIAVAHRLNRTWIGIDITHLAITLIRSRLQDT